MFVCEEKKRKFKSRLSKCHRIRYNGEAKKFVKIVSKIRNPSHTSQPFPEPDRHCDATTESLKSLHGQEKEASARWGLCLSACL